MSVMVGSLQRRTDRFVSEYMENIEDRLNMQDNDADDLHKSPSRKALKRPVISPNY